MDYKRLAFVFAAFSIISLVVLFILADNSKNGASSVEIIEGVENDKKDSESEYDYRPGDAAKSKLAEANKRQEEENASSDDDIVSEMSQEVDELKEITMILSSVAKDIRIRVMDADGIAEGISWVVNIRDDSGYREVIRDEDADGLIHVTNLSSGRYYVMLDPEAGYNIPGDEVALNVRDQISYTAIPDISFEIKTEDQIDPTIEDTANLDEVDHGQKYDIVSDGIKGIDVSKWNKVIDWNKVKDSGVEYAIIRCGYRGSSTGALVLDPYWEFNWSGARAAGVKTGVYFFTQALNETEAVEEASMVISLLGGEQTDYPIFIDVEGSGGRADILDNDTRTKVINAFCNTLTAAGYKSGVYANKNWFSTKINTYELGNVYKWLAQYNVSTPTYDGDYNIWQYTSKGSVAGIEGNVDLNLSYIDF